jgi:hypothetical protein
MVNKVNETNRRVKIGKSIAPRKLKRTCIYCNHTFCKGEVYYKERKVIAEGDEIIADERIC